MSVVACPPPKITTAVVFCAPKVGSHVTAIKKRIAAATTQLSDAVKLVDDLKAAWQANEVALIDAKTKLTAAHQTLADEQMEKGRADGRSTCPNHGWPYVAQ